MKILFLILTLTLCLPSEAAVYRADFRPAGIRVLYGQFLNCNGCWLVWMAIGMPPKYPVTTANAHQNLVPVTNKTCNGSAVQIYSFSIPITHGLHYLWGKSCNKLGCSKWVNMSQSAHTCSGKEVYLYGE